MKSDYHVMNKDLISLRYSEIPSPN